MDVTGPLTEVGLAEALDEAQDLFKVVLRRLRGIPEGVQAAVCLAGLQGVSFVKSLVEELGEARLGRSLRDPLRQAEDRFGMIAAAQHRAEGSELVVERLVYDVARQRRRSHPALGGEQAWAMVEAG